MFKHKPKQTSPKAAITTTPRSGVRNNRDLRLNLKKADGLNKANKVSQAISIYFAVLKRLEVKNEKKSLDPVTFNKNDVLDIIVINLKLAEAYFKLQNFEAAMPRYAKVVEYMNFALQNIITLTLAVDFIKFIKGFEKIDLEKLRQDEISLCIDAVKHRADALKALQLTYEYRFTFYLWMQLTLTSRPQSLAPEKPTLVSEVDLILGNYLELTALLIQQILSCYDADEIGQHLTYLLRKLNDDFEIIRSLIDKKSIEEIEATRIIVTKTLIQLFAARPEKMVDQLQNFITALERVFSTNKLLENIKGDDQALFDCAVELKRALKDIIEKKRISLSLPHLNIFLWLVILDAWETWVKLRHFMEQDLYKFIDADFNLAFHLGGHDFFDMLSSQLSLIYQQKFSSKKTKYILAQYIVNAGVFPFPEILGNGHNFIWQIQSIGSIDNKILPLIAQAFGVTIVLTQGKKKNKL